VANKNDSETMTGTTFRLPKNIRLRMRAYDFINWSAVTRDLLEQKLDQLDSEQWTGNLKESERG